MKKDVKLLRSNKKRLSSSSKLIYKRSFSDRLRRIHKIKNKEHIRIRNKKLAESIGEELFEIIPLKRSMSTSYVYDQALNTSDSSLSLDDDDDLSDNLISPLSSPKHKNKDLNYSSLKRHISTTSQSDLSSSTSSLDEMVKEEVTVSYNVKKENTTTTTTTSTVIDEGLQLKTSSLYVNQNTAEYNMSKIESLMELIEIIQPGSIVVFDIDETLIITKNQPSALFSTYGIRQFESTVAERYSDFKSRNTMCSALQEK